MDKMFSSQLAKLENVVQRGSKMFRELREQLPARYDLAIVSNFLILLLLNVADKQWLLSFLVSE